MSTCLHCEFARVMVANLLDNHQRPASGRACVFAYRPVDADGCMKEAA